MRGKQQLRFYLINLLINHLMSGEWNNRVGLFSFEYIFSN